MVAGSLLEIKVHCWQEEPSISMKPFHRTNGYFIVEKGSIDY